MAGESEIGERVESAITDHSNEPLLLARAYLIFLTNLPDVLARLCLKKGARRDFVNEKLISTEPQPGLDPPSARYPVRCYGER